MIDVRVNHWEGVLSTEKTNIINKQKDSVSSDMLKMASRLISIFTRLIIMQTQARV